jgi:hypothetical protein
MPIPVPFWVERITMTSLSRVFSADAVIVVQIITELPSRTVAVGTSEKEAAGKVMKKY